MDENEHCHLLVPDLSFCSLVRVSLLRGINPPYDAYVNARPHPAYWTNMLHVSSGQDDVAILDRSEIFPDVVSVTVLLKIASESTG